MNLKPFARRASVWVLGVVVLAGCGSIDRPPVRELNNNTNAVFKPENASGTLGSIERLDPALDALLPKDAKVELLVKGLDWSEGPVWSTRDNCLYFSDVPQNVVYRWMEGKGITTYLKPSG